MKKGNRESAGQRGRPESERGRNKTYDEHNRNILRAIAYDKSPGNMSGGSAGGKRPIPRGHQHLRGLDFSEIF